MIITTAGRSTGELTSKAKTLSSSFNLPFIERNGVSIDDLKESYQDDIVVVGKNRVFISPLHNDSQLFFHPNLAIIRAKRMFKGEKEPLIQATKLKEGMSFLDCTLGLASDSIVASIAVGSQGVITGIEGNQLLYLLTKDGLTSFSSGIKKFDEAMKRIKVIHNSHYSYLLQAETKSFDVVYLDPMFHTSVDTSSGINAIRRYALMTEITEEVIIEAKRVAKERVVLKDHWKSERFDKYGFDQQKRKTSLFHYGVIELHK